ncbi:HeH/LEM domain-containing protein [Streptococcus suis]|uniref:HeH/LEM domain-containing protein n=1 Tax=Streptococcus suis TaxID=1307 RepID=UPI001ABDDF7A|nr:hypothetical protein [Streptococcus suis]MDW8651069.1 HeH/LEM domain-containing protein [Streptococcus suis]HEL2109592.1 hypothetical protein [Streptococcus suis]HEM2744591.1 hypothetical protein [Streptococcus suis]HEM2826347.1 hypothetical protein [Streptococcus suis]
MEYKDKKTGQIIVTDSLLSGDWEPIQRDSKEKTPSSDELKSLLTELGVEFNPKAKKAELLELYEANKPD